MKEVKFPKPDPKQEIEVQVQVTNNNGKKEWISLELYRRLREKTK